MRMARYAFTFKHFLYLGVFSLAGISLGAATKRRFHRGAVAYAIQTRGLPCHPGAAMSQERKPWA